MEPTPPPRPRSKVRVRDNPPGGRQRSRKLSTRALEESKQQRRKSQQIEQGASALAALYGDKFAAQAYDNYQPAATKEEEEEEDGGEGVPSEQVSPSTKQRRASEAMAHGAAAFAALYGDHAPSPERMPPTGG